MKYVAAFAGLDAWGTAMERVLKRHNDNPPECVGYWETDKYASNAMSAIHGVTEDLNMWDIAEHFTYDDGTFIPCQSFYDIEVPEIDVFVGSPPCTAHSNAGKREGSESYIGNLWQPTVYWIEKYNPKYVLIENVRGWIKDEAGLGMLSRLEEAGYINYVDILNAKDYGIPQNRERAFIISIRQDIYDSGIRFEFPKKVKLELRLKDLLEDNVDEKYYLSDKIIKGFLRKNERRPDLGFSFSPLTDEDEICTCLTSRYHKLGASDPYISVEQVGNLSHNGSFNGNPQPSRVYSPKGLAPTLNTCGGAVESLRYLKTLDQELGN